MISIIGSALLKALTSIGMALIAGDRLEDLLIWMAEKLAGMTKSSIDDEAVAQIKKAVEESRKRE